jgi:serine/threonine-protein kinase
MGLWGSTRYISPEERTEGAVIDEITVYTLGATASGLFADSDSSRSAWPLSGDQYAIVKKAVNDNRSERQQTIKQLIQEWRCALTSESQVDSI